LLHQRVYEDEGGLRAGYLPNKLGERLGEKKEEGKKRSPLGAKKNYNFFARQKGRSVSGTDTRRRLMAPSAKTTSSLRLGIPERKRSTRAAHIVESVLSLQEEAALSPVTEKLGDELRDRAMASLDGEDNDREDLDLR
jgi:hypothetical protein